MAIALGIALFVVQGRRHPEPETSIYLEGREPKTPVPAEEKEHSSAKA